VILSTFTLIFIGGSALSEVLTIILGRISSFFGEWLLKFVPKTAAEMIDRGLIGGLVAGITIALPYVVPFYIILALMEDTGYLPRAAFLMDNLMHKIGLHGKAFIPLILGYGCTVPACIGCRIMETQRERFIAAFVVTLVPCAARTVVILGLVGSYVGLHAALALYVFDLILILALGRLAFKVLPGEPIGLIMEMPPYKKPVMKNVLAKTWARTKDFLYIAFPIIIGGSLIITTLDVMGILGVANSLLSPVITGWLGLPAEAGIPLFFGILRKELAIILLANLMPLTALTATQMIVFSLVTMIYTPCIATIAALTRELGWRKATAITFIDIITAITLGGLANILLQLI
ncbi:MAG: nucleoside recognition domain-containing protein, partial [Nitrososphaeria archaeon]